MNLYMVTINYKRFKRMIYLNQKPVMI